MDDLELAFWSAAYEAASCAASPRADPTLGPPAVQWTPFPDKDGKPSPQRLAYESSADELFFGGSAGPGKTAVLLGLAFTQHRSSIIFRRIYKELEELVRQSKMFARGRGRYAGLTWTLDDGRILDFAAVQHEEDKEKYRGNPHDLLGFDELPLFTRTQYQFLIGWNRNAQYPKQRCRVVCTGNPPTKPEDRWVIEEWAPWLDEEFYDPAEPGELRWYTMLDGKMTWLRPDVEHVHVAPHAKTEQKIVLRLDAVGKALPFDFKEEEGKVEQINPRSRTFIPGRVDDNPILVASGYKAILQATPEPLRSQLLYGDFKAGMQDDEWQVLPTAWVRAAMERWKVTEKPEGPPDVLGCDPARGGSNKTVISKVWGNWYGPLEKHAGAATPEGSHVFGLILASLAKEGDGSLKTPVHIDVLGVGSSASDFTKDAGMTVWPISFSNGTRKRDRHNRLKFLNMRAWAHWNLREALDPDNGENICLPYDPELLADLCSARWIPRSGGVIQIEDKDEIKKRIGRSPDCSDAVLYASIPPKGGWAAESI